MDVIPELIEEAIIAEFSPADFENFSRVMNKALALELSEYMKNPEADSYVVDKISNFLGSTIELFTLDHIMEERGIYKLVQSLVPQNLASANVDLDKLIEELSFLEENASKLMLKLPTRSKHDWEAFYLSVKNAISAVLTKGGELERSNTLAILEANKFVFYVPLAKDVVTSAGIISKRNRQWNLSLKGAKFLKYCNEHNIGILDRRSF